MEEQMKTLGIDNLIGKETAEILSMACARPIPFHALLKRLQDRLEIDAESAASKVKEFETAGYIAKRLYAAGEIFETPGTFSDIYIITDKGMDFLRRYV